MGRRISLPALRIEALPGVPWLAVVGVVAVAVLGARTSRLLRYNVPDDAVTSMQYAKNLALGNGLVFNVGEAVDGYTNFLWVLLMTPVYALCRALGVPFVPVIAHVGILFAAACVALVYLIAKGSWGRHLAVVLAILFCVLDRAFTTWAALGLEVHVVSAFMLLALYLHRSEVPKKGLYVGLALLAAHLTRPDAALFGVCLLASGFVAGALAWKRGDAALCRAEFTTIAVALATWLVPYAAYFAWHYTYYGAPFPNTYYTKLHGPINAWARGGGYVREFFELRAWLPALGVFAILSVRDKTIRTLLFFVPAHFLYVAYIGGDFMPGHRFLLPLVPMLGLLAAAATVEIVEGASRVASSSFASEFRISRDHIGGFCAALLACGLALLAQRTYAPGPLDASMGEWREDHDRQKKFMTWIRDVKPPNASFATGMIGHVGFYGDVRVIDTFGIIDPVVARRKVKDFGRGAPGHEKPATVDEILAKKPTYVGIFVLAANLWQRGYYLDPDVPRDTVPGVWVRDVLAERGHLVPGTKLDFERREGGFVASGRAFENWPARGNEKGQGVVDGAEGGFLNSYHASLFNGAVGTLTSAPFSLNGDRLIFRLAGGEDMARLYVALEVDGKVVRRATGKNSDLMARVTWDIRPYRDKKGTLVLRDDSSEPWGYIAVDSIAQWTDG